MKRTILVILAGISVLAVLFTVWSCLRSRDERLIRKTLADLQEMVSKSPGEAPAASALKFARPERVFAPRVSIVSSDPARNFNMTDKESAVQISVMRRFFTSLHLACRVENLTIDGEKASGTCEIHLTGISSSSRDRIDEVRISEIKWQKNDGRWQIYDVVIKPLLIK